MMRPNVCSKFWVGGLAAVVLLAGVLLAGGCKKKSYPHYQHGEQRLVCLSPAITQMVIDLGQAGQLVAVASGDPAAPANLPALGRFPRIDYELLVQTRPTDIFIQPSQQGVPQRLQQLAGTHGWRIHEFHFETVKDVLDALYDPKAADQSGCIGGALGIPIAAGVLAARIQDTLESVGAAVAEQPRPQVLLLSDVATLMAAGPNTFLGEMLNYAGGKNVLLSTSERYPVLDKETVVQLKPEVIVILGRAATDQIPPSLRGLSIPAVSDHRIEYLDDPLAQLPSSSMPRVAVKLATLLHPKLADRLAELLQKNDAH